MALVMFRKPEMTDLPVMFAWQRHPQTRENNPRHMYPTWESYMQTIEKAVADPDEKLQLMCVAGHPVGFIVFIEQEHGMWFGIRIAPGLENRGLEGTAIEHAKARFGSRLATTLSSESEQKAFASFGFEREGETDVFRYRG